MSDLALVLLIFYIIISFGIIIGGILQYFIEDCKYKNELYEFGAIGIFWPFYIIFKIPQAIWWFIKFFISSIKYFCVNFFKLK